MPRNFADRPARSKPHRSYHRSPPKNGNRCGRSPAPDNSSPPRSEPAQLPLADGNTRWPQRHPGDGPPTSNPSRLAAAACTCPIRICGVGVSPADCSRDGRTTNHEVVFGQVHDRLRHRLAHLRTRSAINPNQSHDSGKDWCGIVRLPDGHLRGGSTGWKPRALRVSGLCRL